MSILLEANVVCAFLQLDTTTTWNMDKGNIYHQKDTFAITKSLDKMIMNEVHTNYLQKNSSYYGNCVIESTPCAVNGKTHIGIDNFFDSSNYQKHHMDSLKQQQKEFTRLLSRPRSEVQADEPKLRKTSHLQIKGVGFDVQYTKKFSSETGDNYVKQINLEKPCKVAMAIVLILYMIGEPGWLYEKFSQIPNELNGENFSQWSTVKNFLDRLGSNQGENHANSAPVMLYHGCDWLKNLWFHSISCILDTDGIGSKTSGNSWCNIIKTYLWKS